MRTGAEYKESLRDGRNVWVVGEGAVADVTTHPATSVMVDEYAAWYDRHFDPAWQDTLVTEADGNGQRYPLALTPPKTSADLRCLGKAISTVHFLTGGNMTHTPGYGALIALGMLNVLKRLNNSSEDAEMTLGIALALAEVMGLRENPQTIEQLAELTVTVQTTRTCMTAAELEPETTESGHALPNQLHVAAAGLNALRVRQRMSEILRGLPGSSLVNAPADTDFADPDMAAELEDAFGGGGYTALQRAALLQLAWDQVSSGLDGREAVFELHASGGLEAWRGRLRAWFESYNKLADGVSEFIDVDIPHLDLTSLQEVQNPPRRMPRSTPAI